MGGRESLRTFAKAASAVVGSFAGAVVLAGLAQQPLLAFFYWMVPGEKSSDGPILLALAYLLLVLVVPAVLALGSRRFGLARAVPLAIASGPALMAIAAGVCVWMARLPHVNH
jgi:hypothetical protein